MKLFLILLLMGLSTYANGQQLYERSAGLRLGHTSGVTFKSFITDDEAVEFILSGRNEGLHVNVLYLFHAPLELSFNDRFYLHYGIGGHLGYEKFDDLHKVLSNAEGDAFIYEEKSFFTMGIDGSLGVEYRWLAVPVTFGFDLKPYVNFVGMRHMRARFWDAAVSFKYIF